MANRSAPPPDGQDLLNLPLDRQPDQSSSDSPLVVQDLLPFDAKEVSESPEQTVEPTGAAVRETEVGSRFKAGLLDLAAVLGALVLALAGASILGGRPRIEHLPAFALFSASFSFLYTVVPLTFWGQTPGMAVSALVARGRGSSSLTIQQCMKRWLAGVITVLLLGLPALIALTGRSFSDRLSGSHLEAR